MGLGKVNNILARSPWNIQKHHIASLSEEGWSISQIVHAVVILCHFHAMSGTVLTRTERYNYQSTASPRQQSNQTKTTKSVRRATRSSRTNGLTKYQGMSCKCKNTDSDTNQILLE